MKKKFVGGNDKIILNRCEKLLNDYSPKEPEKKDRYRKARFVFLDEFKRYLSFLDEFQGEIVGDQKISKDERVSLLNYRSDQVVITGNRVENEISSGTVRKEIKKLFRSSIGKWAYSSEILRRSYEKPRGYAGDYKMVEEFYDQSPRSSGVGYYFDNYILKNTLATADIYRKDKMSELVERYFEKNVFKKLNVINFGCGACKELRDLFKNYQPNKKINIMGVDQDTEAMDFSKQALGNLSEYVSIDYIQQNIIDLIFNYRNSQPNSVYANKELVYSMGLVDYFADNVLQLFVRFSLKTLAPGGTFIFAHKNSEKIESFLPPDWFCDWKFFLRNKEEVLNIVKDEILGYDLEIEWEKTRHMFFLILTKKNG